VSFTWVDFILLGVMLFTVIVGLVKGFIREIIGLTAAIVGLVLAGQYYENLAALMRPLFSSQMLDYFVSFLAIFFAVVILGWVVASLLSRWTKGPFKLLNHLLGGAVGFLKGILICGVVVLALLVFSVEREAVAKSRLAGYALYVTNGVVQLVPQELKARFKSIYRDIKGKVGKHGEEN
jgi:membrane protein required for colicin V production